MRLGLRLCPAGDAFLFQPVQRFLGFPGIWAVRQDFQVGLVILDGSGKVAGLLQRFAEFVGGFSVSGLPIERFLVTADRGLVVLLLEIVVTYLNGLHCLMRIERVKLRNIAVGIDFVTVGMVLLVVLGR